jgi:hypothetical protein
VEAAKRRATHSSSFDGEQAFAILTVQVPSGSPRKGQKAEQPSEHTFGGFSYLLECTHIKIFDFPYEPFRVYDTHL